MPGLSEKAIENWPAIRTVHLFGGCRAFCGLEPRFEITPKAVSGKLLHGELSNYQTLYSVLESSNLTIIGVEFFYDNRQAEGRLPAEWCVYHRRSKTAWPCEEVTQKWGDIGKSAYDSKMGRLWDVSRRISHQLRVCGWRIREISEAYNRQLTA